MGKQGSLESPLPNSRNNALLFGMKDYNLRPSEAFSSFDSLIGRRLSGGDVNLNPKVVLVKGFRNECGKFSSCKGSYVGKKHSWIRRHGRLIVSMIVVMSFIFLLDSVMVSVFDSVVLRNISSLNSPSWPKMKEEDYKINEEKPPVQMYGRLLNLASNALTEREFRQENSEFWNEPYTKSSAWKPCAHQKNSSKSEERRRRKMNGFIMVSANGGLNQQRVAICNAVAVAALLNATLVLPRFLYSNVWKDPSQFGDIYQEKYFMNLLTNEVDIVKELPAHFKSLDIEKIGSLITDADLPKEANPADYIRIVLPTLKRNGIVHLLGFGNRLGFDPLPSEIQRLRCKCNFHALKFVPKIQRAGSILVKRIRRYEAARSKLDRELLGEFMARNHSNELSSAAANGPSKYLALHLRFEIDMVAYSLCDFGGGEEERRELQEYREEHFPLLLERLKRTRRVTEEELRKGGRCPLTPEEAALVLASLGFNPQTYIYLAGSQIYGGESRMRPLTRLYPNLVTKETLLTPDELAPFKNFSSQLAALDFIACATSDVFAMTDSGSQLSSLVSGFRTYYGGGHAPILRPNKKRLAAILLENRTADWESFKDRVRKMIEEGQRISTRRLGRSIYRQPRCTECMCKSR